MINSVEGPPDKARESSPRVDLTFIAISKRGYGCFYMEDFSSVHRKCRWLFLKKRKGKKVKSGRHFFFALYKIFSFSSTPFRERTFPLPTPT